MSLSSLLFLRNLDEGVSFIECKVALSTESKFILQAESTIGDGYEDDDFAKASHAHTKYELFEGLTIKNATQVCVM